MKKVTLEWFRSVYIGTLVLRWRGKPMLIVAGDGPGCCRFFVMSDTMKLAFNLPQEKLDQWREDIPCRVCSVELHENGRWGSVEVELKDDVELIKEVELYLTEGWYIQAKDFHAIAAYKVYGGIELFWC